MRLLRQAGSSVVLALASLTLVVGGVMLSLGENYLPEAPASTSTMELVTVTSTPAVLVQIPTETTIPSPTNIFIPPTSCPPRPGWIIVSVQPGQTLQTLAAQYHISVSELKQANCLFSDDLPPNALLALPPIPTNTAPPCGPPAGYVLYTVQPGEYPYKLSRAFGISLDQFLHANCISSSDTLHTGQRVYVPNVATHTPLKTPTTTLTPVIIIFPTNTNIPTQYPVPSKTPGSANTSTSTPTPTSTPLPKIETATSTITSFPTPTHTPIP